MKCRDCGEEFAPEERYVFQRCPHCGEFQLLGGNPAPSPEAVRALVEAARALIETSHQDPRGFFVVGEDEICALNATLTPFPAPEAKESEG